MNKNIESEATDSVDYLETDQTDFMAVWLRKFWSILITFFNNDVIVSPLVTNLNSSTAQEIVNWVRLPTGAFTAPTRLNSTVEQLSRVGVDGVYWA